MPMVNKAEGYPVPDSVSAGQTIQISSENGYVSAKVQPSAKDRSIIRQTAWKCAAMMASALGNYYGSPDQLKAALRELKADVEKDMLDA